MRHLIQFWPKEEFRSFSVTHIFKHTQALCWLKGLCLTRYVFLSRSDPDQRHAGHAGRDQDMSDWGTTSRNFLNLLQHSPANQIQTFLLRYWREHSERVWNEMEKNAPLSVTNRRYVTLLATQHVSLLRVRKRQETWEPFGMTLHMYVGYWFYCIPSTILRGS